MNTLQKTIPASQTERQQDGSQDQATSALKVRRRVGKPPPPVATCGQDAAVQPAVAPAEGPAAQAPAVQEAVSQPKGILNISNPAGDTLGTGFYDEEGKLTIILDREPGYLGRILMYDRTPTHPGSPNIPAVMNIRDSVAGEDHLRYLGKLRRTTNGRGWWGDLDATPQGVDQRGNPRAHGCRPPHADQGDKVKAHQPHQARRQARQYRGASTAAKHSGAANSALQLN